MAVVEMIKRYVVPTVAAALVLVLAGCSINGGGPVGEPRTWEEAKAEAQQGELEIAALVPSELVVSQEQMEKGTLFSCGEVQHSWAGRTRLELVPGTDPEPLVQDISAHFRGGETFHVEEYRDSFDHLLVKLISSEGDGYFIVGPAPGDEFTIESGSECFTLPDDVYPGGEF